MDKAKEAISKAVADVLDDRQDLSLAYIERAVRKAVCLLAMEQEGGVLTKAADAVGISRATFSKIIEITAKDWRESNL